MADRWRQVEELFHGALEREGLDRVAFLDEACAGDEALRREVESLLAEGAESAFMEAPAIDAAAGVPVEGQSGMGRKVGDELVRAIFESACGLPVQERHAYAVTACSGDVELLREVETLLSAEPSAARDGPSRDSTPASDISSSAPDEGRFPAGTVLAGRYRVLGLLGKGGMGEVYRAFDIILNQTVALKFLPESRFSEATLQRFRNEVRIARQVSHPNVCRVYDLGMVDELHFLSMEYIDGEDLASLLRRIGRLPQDKAVEFTRKLCAGLSAAHEQRVLHRDLKPANIMIDGKGRVRITDFGLAALADRIPSSDVRSGTPAYMAPEQKAGKEVTVRSDIYSLGLVLHEMFTGQRYRRDSDSNPTDIVGDLDPAIERLILLCLEERPSSRPASALRVAMALPGADPIAAALAAGETPSPEMVAASEEKEGFTPRAAILCFAGVAMCLGAGLLIAETIGPFTRTPLPQSPEGLSFRAQQILDDIGYTDTPADSAFGFSDFDPRIAGVLDAYSGQALEEILAGYQPPVFNFWYRQHWDTFERVEHPLGNFQTTFFRGVDEFSPAQSMPGMILVHTDPIGRLVRLQVEPWVGDAVPREEFDWTILFEQAGLEFARFSETTPEGVPPMFANQRRAWTGSYADERPETVRVEAGSLDGRPVWFDVNGFGAPEAAEEFEIPGFTQMLRWLFRLGLVILAWRNRRRLDWRGGFLVLVTTFLLLMPSGAFYHSSFYAVFAWVGYAAIEPHVRRYWPDALISWTRFTQGQLRNPLVATHVLAGVLMAEFLGIVYNQGVFVTASLTSPHAPFALPVGLALSSETGPLSAYLILAGTGLGGTLVIIIGVFVLARLLIRNLWVADFSAIILLTPIFHG